MSEPQPPGAWSPRADPDVVERAAARLTAAGLRLQREQPLGPWTTFGIGGAARLAVQPSDEAELATVMDVLAETSEDDLPLLVVGRGSNLLVADAGFPGLALRLGTGFTGIRRTGTLVEAGGAASMPALAVWTAGESLTGLEFAAAIPATVGGSVRMNAGAHGGETAAVLAAVQLAGPASPYGAWRQPEDLDFGYRRSTLPARHVVTGARFELTESDRAEVNRRLRDLRAWRRATQPLRQRNCGSVFTNPPGDSAARVVDAAGLKGRRRGGARVSEKHANFIVVERGARAQDVLELITEVRTTVVARGGPLLEPEVRIVGSFPAGGGTHPEP